MFDSLSDKLQGVFKKLKGQAYLTESNINDAMREIRLALLDADVNYEIAKEFVDSVKQECLGQKVLKSVSPGQQVVKVVNDKLSELMGGDYSELNTSKSPSVIMLVGLHGSGKTTTAAKLAAHLAKNNKKPMLASTDIYRPAAGEQLESLGKQINMPVYIDNKATRADLLAKEAKEKAKTEGRDTLILDTAGRHELDSDMIQELMLISQTVLPTEILLIADSALGQEAVSVSKNFHDALGLTGIILTKIDGDARGGAALTMRKVTGCPIKLVGTGEKIENIEVFYPDRMASRILGMGDVVSLVEEASEKIEEEEAEKLEKKLKSNEFDLSDFLSQLRQMNKMGGIEKIMKMMPGGNKLSGINMDQKQFNMMEAAICSMNKKERSNPDIIDFSRRKRIAAGSGVSLQQVNNLLSQFFKMKKMMKNSSGMNEMMSNMGMPTTPGANPISQKVSRGPRTTQNKRKKRKKNKKGKKKR